MAKIPGAKRWLQVGIASWYGGQFQGRKTSDGEKFDMNQLTCAHPTLPMGTWLRVTNMRNQRITFVRVNDRGPLVEGRIIDLPSLRRKRSASAESDASGLKPSAG